MWLSLSYFFKIYMYFVAAVLVTVPAAASSSCEMSEVNMSGFTHDVGLR